MTLGEMLVQAREKSGLCLTAVEESTKISIRMLRSLESGSFDDLPPPVYSRALVRRYAAFLGLDPDAALSLLPKGEDPILIPPAPRLRHPIHHALINVVTAVALVAGILVIAVWMYDRTYVTHPVPSPIAMPFAVDQDATALAITGPGGADRVSGPVTSRARSAPAGPRSEQLSTNGPDADLVAPNAGPTNARPMTIEVRAVEPTNATVRVDGVSVFNGPLQLGDRRTFVGQQDVSVQSTNAGGVEILRNGQVLGLLGRPFEVAERTWTAAP